MENLTPLRRETESLVEKWRPGEDAASDRGIAALIGHMTAVDVRLVMFSVGFAASAGSVIRILQMRAAMPLAALAFPASEIVGFAATSLVMAFAAGSSYRLAGKWARRSFGPAAALAFVAVLYFFQLPLDTATR